MYKTTHIGLTEYSYPVYHNLQAVKVNAQKIANKLRELYPDLNTVLTLFARGSSGIIIATTVAFVIPCTIYYLRKEDEHAHSGSRLQHSTLTHPAVGIVVDDFISSGDTMSCISEALAPFNLHTKIEVLSVYRGATDLDKDLFPNLKHLLT